MSNSSIWPIDRTLSGAAASWQSGPGSDDNEGVLRILYQSVFDFIWLLYLIESMYACARVCIYVYVCLRVCVCVYV